MEFFKELGVREPDYYLGVVEEKIEKTMGNVIAKFYEIMTEVNPDAIIVLGDTNFLLVSHLIWRIVGVTSDIDLCYSENARRNIFDRGVKPEYIHVVGSPIAEVFIDN